MSSGKDLQLGPEEESAVKKKERKQQQQQLQLQKRQTHEQTCR